MHSLFDWGKFLIILRLIIGVQNHRAVSVPKFGDWNAGNADGGGGYTMIFEKMKENKQNGVINPQVPAYTASPRLQQNQKTNAHKPAKSSVINHFQLVEL